MFTPLRTGLCLLALTAPTLARPAVACMCAANPPCAAVWRADAVFTGTVVDIGTERIGGSLSWTVYKVAVSQTFRGSVERLVTLVPGHEPSAEDVARSRAYPGEQMVATSCDYQFQVGRAYLVYVHRTAAGRWTTSRCSGTKPIEDAQADLEYIADIPRADPTGRVYGKVERSVIDPLDRTRALTVPAADIAVALTSASHRLTVTTDSEGKLDVQVPPGEYRIAPVVPPTVRLYGTLRPVAIPARGCAPVYFSIVSNGRIAGRVERDDGSAVPHASVDVFPEALSDDRLQDTYGTVRSTVTDPLGRFSIDAILPGRYYLAVNARYGPELRSPYPRTYFPSTVLKDDASVIELGDGERRTGLTIVVKPLAETTVSGVVTSANDEPIAEAMVSARPAGPRRSNTDSTLTDIHGGFQLRVLAGFEYVIHAVWRTENRIREAEIVVLVDERKENLHLVIGR